MKDFGQAAAYFGELAAGKFKQNLSPVLDLIGNSVKANIEENIGEYQSGIGPFPPTAQLSDVTVDIKLREGLGKDGNADSPLYATGEFHDSIKVHKDIPALSVEIGTDLKRIIYHELGTGRMPPRPTFGPAVLRVLPKLLPRISSAAALGIAGGVWKNLGARAMTYSGNSQSLLPD